MRQAVIENGIVTNIIVAGPGFELPGETLVEAPDAGIGWAWDGERFSPPVAPVSPASVSRRQFRLQLLSMGVLDQVENWIDAQPLAVQIAYESSAAFVRDDAMMQAGFDALGFEPAQVDAFFVAAAGL